MRRSQFIFLSMFVVVIGSVTMARAESVDHAKRRLTDLPPKYAEAAQAVSNALLAKKADPKEYRAQISEREDGRLYVFHLWHLSAFEAEREAKKKGLQIIGNPGGRCCDVIYDSKTRTASQPMLWQ